MLAAARHEVDIETTTNRGRIAGDHLEGRHVAGVLQTRDDGLRGAHSARDFRLCQTGRLPRLDHLPDNSEDGTEPVILSFDLGIGQQFLAELREAGHGLISFARRAANSRAARGVFWVFFTNACTTTTRRPTAVT